MTEEERAEVMRRGKERVAVFGMLMLAVATYSASVHYGPVVTCWAMVLTLWLVFDVWKSVRVKKQGAGS